MRDGVWGQALSSVHRDRARPALFLDRDGVIIKDRGYVCRPEEVQLLDGVASLIRNANEGGIPVAVVTNQSGVGRGYFGWDDFAATQQRLLELLGQQGAHLDLVFACPFHHDAEPPYRIADHPCRKPRPGMLFHAATLGNLDLSRSWIIGDRISDLAAGQAGGLAGGALFTIEAALEEVQHASALAAPEFSIVLAHSATQLLHLPLFAVPSEPTS
ncbi:MAG: HAD family hydrolase [Pseudomonadota bacterium]